MKWRERHGDAASCRNASDARTGAREREPGLLGAATCTLWTKYRGSDPESDFTATGGGDTPSEFQTFAAPTLFQLRLNLGF